VSLIGEALRKARAEAARREAERDGVPIPPTIVGATRRPRRSLGPAAVLAIALATALGGAGLAWVLARSERAPAASTAAATSPAGETHAAAQAAETGPTPASPSAAPAAPPETVPGVPRAQGPATASGAEAPLPDRAATTPPTPSAEAGRDGRTARPEPTGERSFVLRAELGYATLALDFLVFKPGAPFGRINGQDIVRGSTVAGFTVEEIGRDFVRLRDERGPLILKVR
jgi:glucose/arabinose dehydrogenase